MDTEISGVTGKRNNDKKTKGFNLHDVEFFGRCNAIYGCRRLSISHRMMSSYSVIVCNTHAFPKVFRVIFLHMCLPQCLN